MQRHLYRSASWVLVVVVLASSLAAILGTASATTTNYALTGFVDQPGGVTAPPVPAGVTVDLASRATGAVYTTSVVGTGGQFTFTSSGTGQTLAPGYWGLYVPAVANASISGCKPYRCAVLPAQQNPEYRFYNGTVLTNSTYTQVLTNVAVVPYNATLNGTVTQGGSPVAGATVRLLAPNYAGLVLVNNTTNATGFYNLSVPFGSWVLQVTHSSGGNLYTNTTAVKITLNRPAKVNPVLNAYAISGRIYSSVTHGYVTTVGNATLFDPSNSYLYSTPTPSGGFYSFASYPSGFTGTGSQEFQVVVAPVGFQPGWFDLNVTTPVAVTHSVTVKPITSSELGSYDTTLSFAGFNVATGKGTLGVTSNVTLGNDTVLPALPNASVGQLWAQLGLDWNHTLSYPSADLSALQTWIADQGPVFPAAQAGFTINGTSLVRPTSALTMAGFGSTCTATYCGLSSSAAVNYSWATTYTINGTAPVNASSYTISFSFAHPATSTAVYNYTLQLPKHYVLFANTSAPANTALSGHGPSGTWTTFTLESKESSVAAATATFTIVREANLTANIAVTSQNTTFSSASILNSTHDHYTVVLGIGENATFSAAKSTYPAGVNGTQFIWTWGDNTSSTVPNVTTNHTYHHVSGPTPFSGNLEVVSSSGLTNNTTFFVWVVSSTPVAGIASNATAAEMKKAGTTPFLFINWSTTLHFNATATTLTKPNALAISLYSLKAKNYTSTANYSASKGAKPNSNWTVAFGSNTTSNVTGPGHGLYLNFSNILINGAAPGVKGFGWEYNLTLTVWSVVGTSSVAHLTILVLDTEKPVPSFTILNSAGTAVTSIVEGTNHVAVVRLNASGSTDYGNGSIVKYLWNVNNTNSSFKNFTYQNTSVKTSGSYPTLRLKPETTSYHIKLTVWDQNGNKANTTNDLQVAANTSLRPIMEVNNLTGPSSLNVGTSYTYWTNVTVGGGSKAVAQNVTVSFYLLSSSGTGSRTYIGGSPGSVTFYGYSNNTTNATVNATVLATGSVPKLSHGLTVRAVLNWNPGSSGSFTLYAYASATNQFVNNSTESTASTPITVHPNPTTQLLEYGGVAAAAVVVILLLVLYFRRRTRKPGTSKPSSSRSGLERGKRAEADDEDDEA